MTGSAGRTLMCFDPLKHRFNGAIRNFPKGEQPEILLDQLRPQRLGPYLLIVSFPQIIRNRGTFILNDFKFWKNNWYISVFSVLIFLQESRDVRNQALHFHLLGPCVLPGK
jgi:hypothetical protein